MRYALFLVLAILCSCLFGNSAYAQSVDKASVPEWILSSLPGAKSAAYQLYLQHHAVHAAKTASTAQRLVASYSAQHNNTGAISREDSSDYRYSANRGMNPKPGQLYIANMRADMLFDSGSSYLRTAAQSAYQRERRITKAFNAQHLPDTMLIEAWTGSGWVRVQKARYSYNANTKERQVRWESWDPNNQVWYNSHQQGYRYTPAGDILADSFQTWDQGTQTWLNNQKMEYVYDGTGRLVVMLQQTWHAGSTSWVPMSKDSIGYTATGKVNSWTSSIFYAASGVWQNSFRDLNYYNSADYELAMVRQTANGSADWQSVDSTVHAVLNPAGLPLIDSMYVNGTTGWYLNQRATKSYTATDQLSTLYTERMNGGSFSNYYQEYYFYDSYDQLIRRYDRSWNGTSWSTAFTTEQRFYYETYTTTGIGSTVISPRLAAVIYPNPASTEATLAINLAVQQGLRISLFDATGRRLQSWLAQAPAGLYQQRIKLDGIAAGTYHVTVEGDAAKWSGSISVAP